MDKIDITFKESNRLPHRKMVDLGMILIQKRFSIEHRGEGEAITVRNLKTSEVFDVMKAYTKIANSK